MALLEKYKKKDGGEFEKWIMIYTLYSHKDRDDKESRLGPRKYQ